jgi:XTP/dITP diphosphohydrolase
VDLILATRNTHKLGEVSRMLAPFGLGVAPLPEHVLLPPEVGDTFEQNALPKAQTAAAALGVPVIADDSGIESEALGGRPGVRSARFAGEHATDAENLQKLLCEAPAGSALRYVCALAFVGVDGEQRVFFGECTGRLAETPRGERGFGYDPAFLPDDGPHGLTMAELPDAAKDAISHRGRALAAFARWFTGEDPQP